MALESLRRLEIDHAAVACFHEAKHACVVGDNHLVDHRSL